MLRGHTTFLSNQIRSGVKPSQASKKYQELDWAVSTGAVSPLATYIMDITLDRADYTNGFILIVSSASSTANNNSIFVTFTDDINDSESIAEEFGFYSLAGPIINYHIYDYRHKGWDYSDDGKLNNSIMSFFGNMRLVSCEITGAKIRLIWKNFSAIQIALGTFAGRFFVFR